MAIEFIAFAGDCRVFGRLQLEAERLSDMLNESPEIVVRDVLLDSLEDGRVVEMEELTLLRDELYAVVGTGPRGNQARRVRTKSRRMQLEIGPYLVAGQLHAFPGADALGSVLRRGPMVPLTNATIAFRRAGEMQMLDAGTLVVNRELAAWIRPTVEEEQAAFPDVPVVSSSPGPHVAKDYTWLLTYGS